MTILIDEPADWLAGFAEFVAPPDTNVVPFKRGNAGPPVSSKGTKKRSPSPDAVAARNARIKAAWAYPERRAKHSKQQAARVARMDGSARAEWSKNRIAAMTEYARTPEGRAAQSERSKRGWAKRRLGTTPGMR